MKISNLSTALKLLAGEVPEGATVTNPLKVKTVETDSVVVESSVDSDLLIRLRGLTGLTVGSTITVNIDSGDVVVVEAAKAPERKAAKREPAGQGCSDYSAIHR